MERKPLTVEDGLSTEDKDKALIEAAYKLLPGLREGRRCVTDVEFFAEMSDFFSTLCQSRPGRAAHFFLVLKMSIRRILGSAPRGRG